MEVLPVQNGVAHSEYQNQNSKYQSHNKISNSTKNPQSSHRKHKTTSTTKLPLPEWYYDPRPHLIEPSNSAAHFLAKMLEQEIRSAKKTHLSAGEVLLPTGLLQRVSEEVLEVAESECYGVRGMTLHLLYEGEEDCRRMSCLKLDPSTPSTFEVYLTFKQANAGWGFLPQFIK